MYTANSVTDTSEFLKGFKMKKILPAVFFLFAVLANDAFGQTDTSFLRLNDYANFFGTARMRDGKRIIPDRYLNPASDDDFYRFSVLAGDTEDIDTDLEFALLSYYSPPVIQIRPAEADAMLPANNPKQADLKLGAAVFQEIQILRFLGNTAAVGRHEGMLKFITDRGNATRAEVETFYRSGIRGLISATVDEEFNRIDFMVDINPQTSYTCLLTRSASDQYVLSYESYFGTNTKSKKELTATSLEALASAMRNNSADFSSASVDTVRAQAALIPAVVYADWKARGLGDGMALIKETLTNFYLNPSQTTYENVLGMGARYRWLSTREDDLFASIASSSLAKAVNIVNDTFGAKLENDIARGNLAAMMRVPNDSRFNIFSTPYR